MLGVWKTFVCLHWLQSSRTWAWSTDGHTYIAQVAHALLKPKRMHRVQRLLHGDLVELSNWEENASTRWPETLSLHYHDEGSQWTCAARQAPRCDAAAGNSILCAMAYFFRHFHVAALYPSASKDFGFQPEQISALEHVPPNLQTPIEGLRWLLVLLGDLHQPLHWLKQHDYGRKIQLEYEGQIHTLHTFWEDVLPRYWALNKSFRLSHDDYLEKVADWVGQMPLDLFHRWAGDVAGIACSDVEGALEENHADGTRRIPAVTKVTASMFDQWVRLAEKLAVLAGYRLVFLLNDFCHHKNVAEHQNKSNATQEKLGMIAGASSTQTPRNLRGAASAVSNDAALGDVSDRSTGL